MKTGSGQKKVLLPPVLTKRLNKVVNKTIKHGKAVHNKLFLSNRCKIITMDTMDIMEIVGVMTECTVTGLVTWVGKGNEVIRAGQAVCNRRLPCSFRGLTGQLVNSFS